MFVSVSLFMFFVDLGNYLSDFWCHGDKVKFDDFRWLSGGGPLQ